MFGLDEIQKDKGESQDDLMNWIYHDIIMAGFEHIADPVVPDVCPTRLRHGTAHGDAQADNILYSVLHCMECLSTHVMEW